MSEKAEFLVACLDYHLGRGESPREALCLAVEDYAIAYGPGAGSVEGMWAAAVMKFNREEAEIERDRV